MPWHKKDMRVRVNIAQMPFCYFVKSVGATLLGVPSSLDITHPLIFKEDDLLTFPFVISWLFLYIIALFHCRNRCCAYGRMVLDKLCRNRLINLLEKTRRAPQQCVRRKISKDNRKEGKCPTLPSRTVRFSPL